MFCSYSLRVPIILEGTVCVWFKPSLPAPQSTRSGVASIPPPPYSPHSSTMLTLPFIHKGVSGHRSQTIFAIDIPRPRPSTMSNMLISSLNQILRWAELLNIIFRVNNSPCKCESFSEKLLYNACFIAINMSWSMSKPQLFCWWCMLWSLDKPCLWMPIFTYGQLHTVVSSGSKILV